MISTTTMKRALEKRGYIVWSVYNTPHPLVEDDMVLISGGWSVQLGSDYACVVETIKGSKEWKFHPTRHTLNGILLDLAILYPAELRVRR